MIDVILFYTRVKNENSGLVYTSGKLIDVGSFTAGLKDKQRSDLHKCQNDRRRFVLPESQKAKQWSGLHKCQNDRRMFV